MLFYQQLKEIVNYIAKGSLKYAQLEKLLIIKAIEQLIDYPEIGKPFNYKAVNARQITFRNYFIIYRNRTDQLIEIIAIHHHSRLISNNPAFKDDE